MRFVSTGDLFAPCGSYPKTMMLAKIVDCQQTVFDIQTYHTNLCISITLFTLLLLLAILIFGTSNCQKVHLSCTRVNETLDVNYGRVTSNKDVITISMRDRFTEGSLVLTAMFSVLGTSQTTSLEVTYSARDELITAVADGVEIGKGVWNKRLIVKDSETLQLEALILRENGFTAALLYPMYNRNNMSLQDISVHYNVSSDAAEEFISSVPAATWMNATGPSVCRSITNYYGRKRASSIASEANYLFSKSFNVVFSVINIALLLALRDKQLIACRFIAPFVSAFCLLIYDGSMLIMAIWLLVDVSSYEAVLNSGRRVERQILQTVFPIAIFTAVTFYILNVIRYFYVRNLYLLIGNSTDDGASDSKIAIHRKVGSKLTYVILALTLSSIVAVTTISLGVAFAVVDNNVTRLSIMNYIVLISNISIALFGLLATVIDLIIHAKEIRSTGVGSYLFFRDPLMFRIECLIIIAAIIVGVVMYIFTVLTKMEFRARYPILSILDVIFGLIVRLIVSGGFVSLIELKRTICLSASNNRLSAEYQNTLDQFLSKDDQYQLMHSFCQREWSMENLMLYSELKSLKANGNGKITKEETRRIYNRFIKQGSIYQVNFSGKVIPKVEELLSGPDMESEPFETLYELLYLDLMVNLNDTFARLKNTAEYSVLIKRKQFSTELMDREFSTKQ